MTNKNRFLWMKEGVVAGKTGYTAKAGYCYVVAYEQDGKRFCAALLACGWPNNKTYKWKDSEELLSFGADNFTLKDIAAEKSSRNCLPEVTLSSAHGTHFCLEDFGMPHKVPVSIDLDASTRYLLGTTEQLHLQFIPMQNGEKFAKKNQPAGMLRVTIDGEMVGEITVNYLEDAYPWTFWEVLRLLCQEY